MRTRHTRGATLIEMVMTISISAIIAGALAVHLRTLRQTSDLSNARNEAHQSARVAMERITRQLRAARSVTAVTAYDDDAGSITVTDFDGVEYVFARDPATDHVLYGIDAATHVLATGVQTLRFQGYDAQGEVDPTNPSAIEAVQIVLVAAIGEAGDTETLSTRVRIRYQAGGLRSTQSYASAYTPTDDDGISYYWRAYGEPDQQYARFPEEDGGGKFYGFEEGSQTGSIQHIAAAIRMKYREGRLRVIVRHETTELFDQNYTYGELEHVKNEWVWWQIDLTDTRASWAPTDLPKLSIEVRQDDEDDQTYFDAFSIIALFDPPQTSFLWADREGGNKYPKHWDNPSNAFGSPNDTFATAYWQNEDKHSFRVTAASSSGMILSVHACINGYLVSSISNDDLELRTALPSQNQNSGVEHKVDSSTLAAFVGPGNKGNILVEVTNDRVWTWDDLDGYEIRIKLDKHGGADTTLKADAVGWRVVYIDQDGIQLTDWAE